MKHCFTLVILILAAQLGALDNPVWAWAQRFGGSDWETTNAISAGRYGTSYVCGSFVGSASFGAVTLTDDGDACLYVAKYDANGVCAWASKPGENSLSEAYGIAADGSGNSYIIGYYYESAAFGSTILNCAEASLFVAKLGPAGNWLWAVQPSATGFTAGYGIACDFTGGLYICGNFTNTATFGADTLTSAGQFDVFAAKLDTAGNWIWARRAGGTSTEEGLGVAVISMGSCVISGHFAGSAAFGATTLTSSGGIDAFVASLSTGGAWQWAKKAGGTGNDNCQSVCLDFHDNVCCTGNFSGSASFGATTLSCPGSEDIFVAKLDPAGNWLWAVNRGSGGWAGGMDICVDRANTIFVTGSAGATGIPSSVLVAQLDENGGWTWSMDVQGSFGELCGYGIAADNDGNILMAGTFTDLLSFGGTTLSSAGGPDGFLAKLTELGIPEVSIQLVGGHPFLSWQPMPPGLLFRVYGNADPCAPSHWELLGSTYERTYTYSGPEDCLFFRVTAEQE